MPFIELLETDSSEKAPVPSKNTSVTASISTMTESTSVPPEKERRSPVAEKPESPPVLPEKNGLEVEIVNEKAPPPTYKHAVTKEEFLSPSFKPTEIRRIVQEGILLGGGAVAILLQVAHPGVGAGVDEHSNFAYRPVDRLRTTMTYVYCMAFGTPEEKRTIVELVNRAHTVVNGKLKEGKDKGKSYNAFDPELQLWVASTLYAAGLDIYEKVFGQIDPSKADQIYKEYSVLAVSLQVPPEMWPKDRRAFWQYWDNQIATLEITEHGRSVAKDLLWTKNLPFYLAILMPAVRILTTEWLPERMRDEYGLKSTKSRRAMYKLYMGTIKGVYPLLPKFLRTYPVRHYLKDMRKRMKNMDHIIGKQEV